MNLRIVAGSAGGRRLKVPKGRGVEIRPTQDRIKQAIFSALGNRVPEARVLDLFAGTGALGLEALSRGATRALFVEQNRTACQCITENIALCGFTVGVGAEDQGRVLSQDALDFLRRTPPTPYDLVFADPPYDKTKSDTGLHPLFAAITPWLGTDGILVWEYFSGQSLDHLPPGLRILLQRRYGETGICFLTPGTPSASE
ncbi:16S rRNA (guanine966-N2)-methyltransferase [Verrucomicrobium sp. GAS474]|uniref:16S rRNA (guanine(966)-N(2))-methyltransferase RsmD n=1 Tax=Verrucomicrobium sp. GAS474 TaxID=1882831 RepID=UPI00087CECE8|nr:16S rRNA (guanine(966)-N(2))-methyltransferase RsmD [Verrucomicrobium sp. GAS474]SDU15820.1 16S rRNA (guanine966-N2)-methyltransferase [Verrucomicrobium sp. GAS474]